MNPFAIQLPTRIEFGWGSRQSIGSHALALGRRPLVVTGKSLRAAGTLAPLLTALQGAGLEPQLHEGVPAEPDLKDLQACMDAVGDADLVVGIGGGSVLDIAKAAGALAPGPASGHPKTARDYFYGEPLPATGRPIIAMPTTSGTGSEVTWACILVDRASRRKASIRGPAMMPAVAIVDPELTVTCPRNVTAASGADAYVQAIEALTSNGANDFTDALAFEAAVLARRSLARAVDDPNDREAREAMALASTMAGMALNTSRLGLVHGLAHPVGAVTGAAHGVVCGLLMPWVMRYNAESAGVKYARLARELGLVSGDDGRRQAIQALVEDTCRLLESVGVPLRLREIGFDPADLNWIAEESLSSGSTKANPRPVTLEDAMSVASAAM